MPRSRRRLGPPWACRSNCLIWSRTPRNRLLWCRRRCRAARHRRRLRRRRCRHEVVSRRRRCRAARRRLRSRRRRCQGLRRRPARDSYRRLPCQAAGLRRRRHSLIWDSLIWDSLIWDSRALCRRILRTHLRRSPRAALRSCTCHQRQSEAIRGHQRPSAALRSCPCLRSPRRRHASRPSRCADCMLIAC